MGRRFFECCPATPDVNSAGMSDVTQLLDAAAAGDPKAAADLLPLVYDELRKLAAARMAPEASDHTPQPTALVHEAYLRLVGTDRGQPWNSRGHFFAAAAEAMRRILVDNARRKKRPVMAVASASPRHGRTRPAQTGDAVDLFALSDASTNFEAASPPPGRAGQTAVLRRTVPARGRRVLASPSPTASRLDLRQGLAEAEMGNLQALVGAAPGRALAGEPSGEREPKSSSTP